MKDQPTTYDAAERDWYLKRKRDAREQLVLFLEYEREQARIERAELFGAGEQSR